VLKSGTVLATGAPNCMAVGNRIPMLWPRLTKMRDRTHNLSPDVLGDEGLLISDNVHATAGSKTWVRPGSRRRLEQEYETVPAQFFGTPIR